MNYRILGPDEVIQAGDEFVFGEAWTLCLLVGVKASEHNAYYNTGIRRPIPAPNGSAPDDLTRELAEALGIIVETADRLHSELLCIGESVQDQKVYIELEQARAVLAKYKEQVKVYEAIEGKAVKCD